VIVQTVAAVVVVAVHVAAVAVVACLTCAATTAMKWVTSHATAPPWRRRWHDVMQADASSGHRCRAHQPDGRPLLAVSPASRLVAIVKKLFVVYAMYY